MARFRRPEAVAISVPSRGVLARQGNGIRLLSQPAAVPMSCGESDYITLLIIS